MLHAPGIKASGGDSIRGEQASAQGPVRTHPDCVSLPYSLDNGADERLGHLQFIVAQRHPLAAVQRLDDHLQKTVSTFRNAAL